MGGASEEQDWSSAVGGDGWLAKAGLSAAASSITVSALRATWPSITAGCRHVCWSGNQLILFYSSCFYKTSRELSSNRKETNCSFNGLNVKLHATESGARIYFIITFSQIQLLLL